MRTRREREDSVQSIERFRVLDELYESPRSLVCRAERVDDHGTVILKILKESCVSPR